ncbi:hypothetical protein AHAS_Ahas03G0252000 [Arachis hypogaea]
MIGAGYMTNGYKNGQITATVDCKRGICSQLLTSNRLLITRVGAWVYSGCG